MLEGYVTSDDGDKTITVKVARNLPTWMKWSQEADVKETTCRVRDEENKFNCHVGDLVRIEEVPPSSGHWRLKAVLVPKRRSVKRRGKRSELANEELVPLIKRQLRNTDPAADATAQRPGKSQPIQRQPRRAPPKTAMPSSTATASGTGKRGHGNKGASEYRRDRVRIGQEPKPPDSEPTPTPPETDESVKPFARNLHERQTLSPSKAPHSPVMPPPGGPKTEKSAREHTGQSARFGRLGTHVPKTVRRWESTRPAVALEGKFRSMVLGDYGRRCQLCGKTFGMPNGESQVFIVHIVPPQKDHRTNHFGNLVGLCGWHYALVRYGGWALLNPETREPFGEWEQMRDFVLKASEEMDEGGNPYIRLPVRFWNVYQGWESTPGFVDEVIRYSIPHWMYLRELLST